MTPLGCPDCLLIRYEPRALYGLASERARAHMLSRLAVSRPSSVSLEFFFSLNSFLGLSSFFYGAAQYRFHIYENSRAEIRSRGVESPVTRHGKSLTPPVTISLECHPPLFVVRDRNRAALD